MNNNSVESVKKKEIKKWSVYFQNPEFLERTRMFMIQKDLYPLVRKWCGVKAGVRLLDVGCGTGYFTGLLVSGDEDVSAVGIDMEEPFIEYARKKASDLGLPAEFIVGDALSLPFEDNTFDIVTSHTFFTSIPDPEKAMSEMKRVVKPGGIISSVTAMNFMPACITDGEYPEDCTWAKDFKRQYLKIYTKYLLSDPLENRTKGVKCADVPRFFTKQGLKDVSLYPLGKVFSLSNAAISDEDKLRYIDLYFASETKKLDAYMELDDEKMDITKEEADAFRSLLDRKCTWLREHLHDNNAWEWQGGANLLVTGICDK